jgi:xanthomonalisin
MDSPINRVNFPIVQEKSSMKNQGQASSRAGFRMKLLPGLVLAALAASAHAATAEAWVATTTKAHDPRAAVHVAPLKDGEQVDIVVSLQLRNKTALDALTAKLMTGAAGARPLTSAEFLAQHAPTAAQAQAVVDYLRAQGFVNIEVAPNRLLVSATGGAGSVRNAFKADLHEYDANGRRAYANVTDAQVPAHLSSTVLGVVGLQTVHLMHTMAKRLSADTVSTQAVTPQAITGVNPVNFPAIYGASGLASASTATIGIITQGSVTQTITDLKSFASTAGYPVPTVVTTVVGTASTDTSGVDEWNMDTQSSLAAAGGTIKQMILYNVNSLSDANLTKGYNKAVSDNLAKAINVSLGGCESDESSVEATQDAIFQSAVAQGQMFSVSSGDSGAWECGASAVKSQSYPAVSPYVMAIGGTTLTTTGGNTWSAETVWSCTSASTCQQSSSGGAGGGPSLTETAPSWQTASGVLGTATKRGVPDISFDASPNSGALILVNGSNAQIGGTSLSAPIWAGFWSRIQAAHGNTLAFPASTIYAGAAANPSWFHDVVSGSQGYSAATGWDYATGYGSVNIGAFSASYGSSGGTTTPTANFSVATSGLTATFTDSSSDSGGTINSYAWTFGDSGTSTVQSPTHTYAAAGTYSVTETVTDSGGVTASKTASVTVSSGSTGATELLLNGGFESGSTSWTLTSGVLCTTSTCSGETSHAGTYFAWLDGYGSTHTDSATQSVAITAGKTSATLTFYLHIDTSETSTTAANDKLSVQVLNSAGTVLATLATYSNLNAASGYALKTLSLTPYIGQTVKIKFNGVENSSKATSFVIDDVSVKVQ